MPSVLIVGATRGLGASLAKLYAAQGGTTVYGTSRTDAQPDGVPSSVRWLSGIDLTSPKVGEKIVTALGDVQEKKLDVVVGHTPYRKNKSLTY